MQRVYSINVAGFLTVTPRAVGVRVNEHICFPPNANDFPLVSASKVREKGTKLGEGERY